MTHNISSALQLLDLDIPELGYLKFISSWLYQGPKGEGNFLVDPGPACTIPTLFKTLDSAGVKHLDWVLLTHIHQDHAGGLGNLIQRYPEAKVVCHEKGKKHLVNPDRLWEGSKEILGKVAHHYGKILPVPEKNVIATNEIVFGEGIRVIPTPGHASHHQCYSFRDWFFAGELFGAHIPMDSGLYLRPATPHRFILEDYLSSMAFAQKYLDKIVCFAHYGQNPNLEQVLSTAKEQLMLWVKIIREYKNEVSGKKRDNYNLDAIIDELLRNDKTFSKLLELDEKMQNREMEFSKNSIWGILKYIETR